MAPKQPHHPARPPAPTTSLIAGTPESLGPIVAAAVVAWLDERLPELTEQRPALIDAGRIGRELGCSTRTVARLRDAGMPCILLGDSPRYELEPCLQWLRERSGKVGA